jgi:tRNA (mo5U34)-methyltransferase
MSPVTESAPADLTRSDQIRWYHTIDLPGGGATQGFVDTRAVAAQLPFPDLTGRRCLDVGTMNGFWAFELERRGAASVTTIDVDDLTEIDWPPRTRLLDPAQSYIVADDRDHTLAGFHYAREALGSLVQRRALNVYDLSPETIGPFDFVFVGSTLLHLRDPIGALDRIRSVCTGEAVILEGIDLAGTLISPRRPRALLDATTAWYWTPNLQGLRRMIESAGFELIERSPLVFIPTGAGFRTLTVREILSGGLNLVVGMRKGFPHIGWHVRPLG